MSDTPRNEWHMMSDTARNEWHILDNKPHPEMSDTPRNVRMAKQNDTSRHVCIENQSDTSTDDICRCVAYL